MKKYLLLSLLAILGGSANRVIAQAKNDQYKLALADYKEAEKEMNGLYNKILKAYSGDTEFIKKFKESQRIWLLSRDANLDMIFPEHKSKQNEYGPGLPVCKVWELKDMTDDRIDFLNQWVDGVDDGADCAGSRKTAGDNGD